jgi:[acyl-carrier-protein] S-malonyltransferase
MVAIIGGDEAAVRKLCEIAAGGQVLVPANFNAPGQIVISGDLAACERAVAASRDVGVAAKPLPVAGAFHSPLMQSAADRMADELAKANITAPAKPVYSNVTAQVHTDVASIKRLLVDQIVNPVRWEQTMSALNAASISPSPGQPPPYPSPGVPGEGTRGHDASARFIELAPGKTLAGLAKRINRKLVVEENAGWKPKVQA